MSSFWGKEGGITTILLQESMHREVVRVATYYNVPVKLQLHLVHAIIPAIADSEHLSDQLLSTEKLQQQPEHEMSTSDGDATKRRTWMWSYYGCIIHNLFLLD